MDDQMNQGQMPGGLGTQGMDTPPVMPDANIVRPVMPGVSPMDSSMGSGMQAVQQEPASANVSADPDEKILESLARIEGKLDAVAAKVGA